MSAHIFLWRAQKLTVVQIGMTTPIADVGVSTRSINNLSETPSEVQPSKTFMMPAKTRMARLTEPMLEQ